MQTVGMVLALLAAVGMSACKGKLSEDREAIDFAADIKAIGGWSEGNLSVNEAYQALFYQVIILP